jgi:heat shock protein HslJ
VGRDIGVDKRDEDSGARQVQSACAEPRDALPRLAAMTRRSVLPPVIGVALVLLLGACRGAGSGQAVSLDGTWILAAGTSSGAAIPLVPGRDVTLVIDGDTVSGRACNLYSGSVTIDGSHVTLGELSMTEMACDEPMMTTEAAYHSALGSVDTAARSGDTLTLTGPGATLRYTLAPPVAQMPLIATHWVLETLIDGDVASSTLGEPATLFLAPDGTASGSTGCRSITARYSAGDRLVLSDLSVQTMLCTRDLTPQDQLITDVLSSGASVEISGSTLTLRANDGRGLVYRASSGSTGPGGGTAEPLETDAPAATPPIADPDPVERVFATGKPLPIEPVATPSPAS